MVERRPRGRWQSRGRGRQGGKFVVLVGPDGVGKTSVARSLLERWEGPTGYFHFRPQFSEPLEDAPPEFAAPAKDKGTPKGNLVAVTAGWLRLGLNLVRFWLGYLATVRPALHRGALVVGDRWAYGYIAQPYALKYYGPRWLARSAIAALPRPDLVALLVAPPQVIHGRKQELTIDKIDAELREWSAIPIQRLATFDATAAVADIADVIERRLVNS